mgnify:CR=1 FL=1
MTEWLTRALGEMTLPEEAEGWVLGRGVPSAMVEDMGIVVWDSHHVDPAPDPVFTKSFGAHGELFHGRLATPIWSARGRILGMEIRTWGLGVEKRLVQFLLPEAQWHPVLIGLTPASMARLWAGGDVWVGEGLYDMGALAHAILERDVAFSTLRAKVSPNHVLFFKRFARGWVHMAYDNDETGRKQTHGWVDPVTQKRRWGAIESLTRVGVKVRDVPYRGGKDPGEIWERRGLDGVRQALNL